MRLIVAGIPRCGTTYLYASIIGRQMNDVDGYDGCVIKTHSLAPYRMGGINCWKAIFVFGDPIHAIISTKRNIYDKFHFENCGCFRDPSEVDIYREDALGYEKMFDSWMYNGHGYPVLAIRYDTIPKYHKETEEFVGQKVQWLPWLPIPKQHYYFDVNKRDFEAIFHTYHSLIVKVNKAKEIEVFN